MWYWYMLRYEIYVMHILYYHRSTQTADVVWMLFFTIIMIWWDYDGYDLVGFSIPPSQHANRGCGLLWFLWFGGIMIIMKWREHDIYDLVRFSKPRSVRMHPSLSICEGRKMDGRRNAFPSFRVDEKMNGWVERRRPVFRGYFHVHLPKKDSWISRTWGTDGKIRGKILDIHGKILMERFLNLSVNVSPSVRRYPAIHCLFFIRPCILPSVSLHPSSTRCYNLRDSWHIMTLNYSIAQMFHRCCWAAKCPKY